MFHAAVLISFFKKDSTTGSDPDLTNTKNDIIVQKYFVNGLSELKRQMEEIVTIQSFSICIHFLYFNKTTREYDWSRAWSNKEIKKKQNKERKNKIKNITNSKKERVMK